MKAIEQARHGVGFWAVPATANDPGPPPGTVIEFAVPATELVAPGSTITFTQSTGTTPATGCAQSAGTYQIYDTTQAVPGPLPRFPDADSGRVTGVIVVSQTAPLPFGTKVGNITHCGSCATGGVTHALYRGFTQ